MLFILILTYLGVWACAYAAVHSWRGRFAFWVLYVLSVTCVPLLSGISLKATFNAINPDYGATISTLPILLGMVLALVAYPIKYLRAKVEG